MPVEEAATCSILIDIELEPVLVTFWSLTVQAVVAMRNVATIVKKKPNLDFIITG